MSSFVVRCPNQNEIDELQEYVQHYLSFSILDLDDPKERIPEYIMSSMIAVFDEFLFWRTEKPVKVMMVVWPDAASKYQLFTWDENQKIRPVMQDENTREEIKTMIEEVE